jgi:hypothetical protein
MDQVMDGSDAGKASGRHGGVGPDGRLRHAEHDTGGDEVAGDAGQDRHCVAVADVEGESGDAGADQGAECHAGIEHAEIAWLQDFAYYLVYPETSYDRANVAAFRDWIMGAASADSIDPG